MKASTLSLSLATLLGTALAVPEVTPVPLNTIYPNTCVFWPSYMSSPGSDTTGSLIFEVSDADDTAVNGLPLQQFSINWAGAALPILGADLRASRSIAKEYFRCANGQATIGMQLRNITISKESRNSFALVQAPKGKGYELDVYAHEVDGVRQDGVFLGAQNQTTWGFYYRSASCGSDGSVVRDFYEVKLLGLPEDPNFPPTAGYPSLFEGFIKVKYF